MSNPIRHAKNLLNALMHTAGEGPHLLTLTAVTHGAPVTTEVPVINRGNRTALDEETLFPALAVLASAVHSTQGGSVVLRTATSPTTATVRTWRIHTGRTHPLTADETRTAYSTNPATGQPFPPEPGVTYADAPHLGL